MKKLLPLLACLPLSATELSPYFSPLFEPQLSADYLYQHEKRIETPLGSFDLQNPINNAIFSFGMTVWPRWNVEAEVLFSSNPATEVNFSYQATKLTGRYLLYDQACGDYATVATGATLFAVRSAFLSATSCWFHGNFNSELNISAGREFLYRDEWWMRLWAYAGLGMANKGNPWWHLVSELDLKVCRIIMAPMLELVYGTGSHDINPAERFPGYAGINHQLINLGLSLKRESIGWGTLMGNFWYNVHARNFPDNYWGLGVTWLYPIGI
ncbi:MAG: hypothetical protein S4CHLAM81_00180 [Chlamydiales bacterium]|nr:hypothetical protein [Chlamydiales bacterium]MCH9634820.1 hypothetical protein [Chlamydiales bacterium]